MEGERDEDEEEREEEKVREEKRREEKSKLKLKTLERAQRSVVARLSTRGRSN
jgi:hypothetical protein